MDDPTPTPTDLRRLLLAIADEIRYEKEGYVQLWGVDEAELRWLASHLPEMMADSKTLDALPKDAMVSTRTIQASREHFRAASPLLQGEDRR